MERRFINLNTTGVKLEQRADGQAPLITGYAAVYYNAADAGTEYRFEGWVDTIHERIMPGAFDESARSADVRALFNHDADNLLGRTRSGTLKLNVDSTGLRYEIEPPDTDIAKRVIQAIQRGDLTGSSFAFSVPIGGQTWRDEKVGDNVIVIREIRKVDLFDVGPVVFPAYEATTTGIRSADDATETRKAYEQWRESQKDLAAKIQSYQVRARLCALNLTSAAAL